MLADSELEDILRNLPGFPDARELLETAVQKLVRCPLCGELFPRHSDLAHHVKKCHTDQFVRVGSKRIAVHEVEEGDERIYICPYCFWAVGEGRYGATSEIYKHVHGCQWNFSRKDGPARVSYFPSKDTGLINDYWRNSRDIDLYSCPECDLHFGSTQTLVDHMTWDHSSASCDQITEEQLHLLQLAAERFLKNATATRSIVAELTHLPANINSAKFTATTHHVKPSPAVSDGLSGFVHNADSGTSSHARDFYSMTARAEDIDSGCLTLPIRLASSIGEVNWVTVHLSGNKNVAMLRFESYKGVLVGLQDWFRRSATEPGDIIRFRVLRSTPPEIQIWTEWDKHINYLIRCPAEDFEWERFAIRDCLIKVLTLCQEPTHYRSLYAQISKHRDLAIGSVLATLSKYRGVLFAHTGSGLWSRMPDDTVNEFCLFPARRSVRGEADPPKNGDAIWKTVAEIEAHDAVYTLLKRTRDSLSFVQICQKIADTRGIDWHELQHTGFLKADDHRLKRLKNGHFALREWFDDQVVPPSQPTPDIAIVRENEQIVQVIDGCENSDTGIRQPEQETNVVIIDNGESERQDTRPLERKHVVPIIGDGDHSPIRPAILNGLLAKMRTVVAQILRVLVRWTHRGPHA